MNSLDYLEVAVELEPFSEEAAEILIARLSDLPYDTFMVEEPRVLAYTGAGSFDSEALEEVLGGLKYSVRKIEGSNWNSGWDSFDPFCLDCPDGTSVWIMPEGSSFKVPGRGLRLRLSAEMAFGTGRHDTTRMLLEIIASRGRFAPGRRVMDLGCGTGVLGLLCAKLGASAVTGIDIDEAAVMTARRNVRLNRLSRRMAVGCGDASSLESGAYDLILANIHRNILIDAMPLLAKALCPGGSILLSGFYRSDVPALLEAGARFGLRPGETMFRDSSGEGADGRGRGDAEWAVVELHF